MYEMWFLFFMRVMSVIVITAKASFLALVVVTAVWDLPNKTTWLL